MAKDEAAEKLRLRNEVTGELHIVARVRHAVHTDAFTMLFREEMLTLLCGVGATMSALEWKVFVFLLTQMEFGNTVTMTIRDLAAAVGHDRSSVSRALPLMEDRGLILRLESGGGFPRRIVVNPHLAFRGRVRQRKEVMEGLCRERPSGLTLRLRQLQRRS